MKRIHDFDAFVAGGVARIPQSYHKPLVVMTILGSFWLVFFTGVLVTTIAYTMDKDNLLPGLITVILLAPLAEMLKLLTRRQRPKTLFVKNMRFKTYSFPSGHAYVSALMCGYLMLVLGSFVAVPLQLVAVLALAFVAFTIGLSRIYLGAHFPSDVVAGWLLAISVLVMVV